MGVGDTLDATKLRELDGKQSYIVNSRLVRTAHCLYSLLAFETKGFILVHQVKFLSGKFSLMQRLAEFVVGHAVCALDDSHASFVVSRSTMQTRSRTEGS